MLFSNLLSSFIDNKNIIRPRIEKTNVNATLNPSLILERVNKCNNITFIIITMSDDNQLNFEYSVNINPIKELIKIRIKPITK
jgi:hypothetical protein